MIDMDSPRNIKTRMKAYSVLFDDDLVEEVKKIQGREDYSFAYTIRRLLKMGIDQDNLNQEKLKKK